MQQGKNIFYKFDEVLQSTRSKVRFVVFQTGLEPYQDLISRGSATNTMLSLAYHAMD